MYRTDTVKGWTTGGVLLIAVALIALPISAQVVGLKAGFSRASLARSETPYRPFAALAAGAFVTYPVAAAWSIRSEVLFGIKGGELVGRDFPTGFSSVERVVVEFLEIPILVQWTPAPGERLSPYAFAGPGVAIRHGCTIGTFAQAPSQRTPVWIGEPCQTETPGGRDRYVTRGTEVGFYGGVGVRMRGRRFMSLAEVQLNHGLSSVQPASSQAVRSRRWTLFLGVGWHWRQ